MKKIRKRLLALGAGLAMLASSAVSMSASAWEMVNWPGDYTPGTGRFYVSSEVALVQNCVNNRVMSSK